MTMASACSGLLDQEAISNLTQQDFWKTRDDANAGLTAVYDGLQSTLGSDFLVWGDFRSDEVEFIEGESNPTPDQLLIMRDQLHPRLGPANWSEFYNLIARCNNLLSNVASISDLTEDEKNNFLGQGYFIRALAYFYAVRIWGDVPLILEPYTSSEDDFFVSRTPQNTVLSAIKDDLEEAVNKLPKSSSPNKGTWGGAMALKAHVYAWENDYNSVVSVTNELINSSIYNLVSTGNYSSIFESEDTNESIFELVFDFSSYQEINGIADQFLAQPYLIGLSPRFQPSQTFLDSFEPGDIRLDYVVFTGSTGTSPELILKYFGSDNGNSSNEFRIADDNIILFRLADIYLLRAEAYNELDQQVDAIQSLDVIRNRAGLPGTTASTKQELKDAILTERLHELCFEGHRFFDLVRNAVAVDYLNDIDNTDQLLWPVHEDRIIENPKIEQNEFYQ